MTNRQLALLAVLAVVWGSSFLFIRVIVDDGMGPAGVSALRTGLGALTLLPFAWRGRRGLPRTHGTWLALAALGLVNFAIPWTLFGVAAQHAPSGVASIANSTQPLWAAILAAGILHADRPSGARLAGLLVGFAGVLVLMGGDLFDVRGEGFTAILLMLLATFCYGVSAVSIRRWLTHIPPIPLASAQVGFAALYLMPTAFLSGSFDDATFTATTWVSLVGLGAFGSGLAVVFYMNLIQQYGPVRASVVTYLIPPVGVFLGWLFLDEAIGWNMLLGLTFVVVGVALVQGVPVRRLLFRRAEPALPLDATPTVAGGE